MRTYLEKTAVVALGILLCLLMLEGMLRTAGFLHTRSRNAGTAVEPGVSRILCIGDSFVYGMGAPADKSFPRQLETILNAGRQGGGIRVINLGMGGDNTTQMYERLEDGLERVTPDIVVILGGMNNDSNPYGYHRFTEGEGLAARLLDQAARIRLYKLGRYIRDGLRRKASPAKSPPVVRREEGPAPAHAADMRKAETLFDRKDYGEALAYCRKVAAAAPRDPSPYFLMGQISRVQGRFEEAARYYRQSLERDRHSYVFLQLGNLYQYQMEDYGRAFAAYREAIELVPPSRGANYGFDGMLLLYRNPAAVALRNEIKEYLESARDRVGEDYRYMIDYLDDEAKRSATVSRWIEWDMRRIIEACRGKGVAVILLGYPQWQRSNGIAAKLAAAYSLPFVDNEAAFSPLLKSRPRNNYLAYDDLHCNAEGYRVMAENVRDTLLRHGLVPGRETRSY